MLIDQLPDDAATWSGRDCWPRRDELAALAIEQHDRWSRALFAALRNQKRIQVPGPMQIHRPGAAAHPDGPVVQDLAGLAGFFNRN